MNTENSLDEGLLLVDISDQVAILTLNRPQVRNALNVELLQALGTSLGEMETRDDVSVIILTGTDPAFCSGLDLQEIGINGGIDIGEFTLTGAPFGRGRKPLIGAINGAAITGGLEIALTCDFLIASERATFADTHTRVGLLPFWGLSVLLTQAIGVRNARYMSATSNFIDAHQATAMGLVSVVVAHELLIERATALAHDILGNDQSTVQTLLSEHYESLLQASIAARKVELERAIAWQGSLFDASHLASLRRGIVRRGDSPE